MQWHLYWEKKQAPIAFLAIAMIAVHLLLRFLTNANPTLLNIPLLVCLVLGGVPLLIDLVGHLLKGDLGSDMLAGTSIVTALLLDEYLAGAFVVLMLSGGTAIENYAVSRASSVLKALANRMPSTATRRVDDHDEKVPIESLAVGDLVVVPPHQIAPVDGTVVDGQGMMDESYLTGEPYQMSKSPGSSVLSGAINGDHALIVRTDRAAVDSRYAKIIEVISASEQKRPKIRRLGDQLGAGYAPVAITIAVTAWLISGDPVRFLAVLVVATPCPLLIAIPVAIIGSISLAARRGIIIRDPSILERVEGCRTMIFDKTGTLTYGRPELVAQHVASGLDEDKLLQWVSNLERYSKHPLAQAIVDKAQQLNLNSINAEKVSERPGKGLAGRIAGKQIHVTSRDQLLKRSPQAASLLPPLTSGLECVILVDDRYAATYQFRDEARADGEPFVAHLFPSHQFDRVMLVSGDRESEVKYLAAQVGIEHIYAEQSPEQKLELVREETRQNPTMFVGDGINDAPALTMASVGVAFGQHSDITSEAAGAIILDSSLKRVDELLHIGRRMRTVALQSAVGGMALSIIGMGFAAIGWMPPVAGAIAQELIDVLAVVNALRAALPPRVLSDYEGVSTMASP